MDQNPCGVGLCPLRIQRRHAPRWRTSSKRSRIYQSLLLLPRDAYFAIADKAKTLGVTFAGHVPFTISLIEASAAGQDPIEHMSDVLFAASSQEEEFRGELNAAARLDPSDSALRPIRRKQAPAVFASYDSGKADRLFETLAKNGTSVVPTLVVERSTAFLDDDTFTNDPRLKRPRPSGSGNPGTRSAISD